MTSSYGLSTKLLSAYWTLDGCDRDQPLHAEVLSLLLEGALDFVHVGLVLCGMWTPTGYAEELSELLGTAAELKLNLRRKGVALVPSPTAPVTLSALSLLSKLGMYRQVAACAVDESSVIARFLKARALAKRISKLGAV